VLADIDASGKVLRGALLEVLQRSPERRRSPCELADVCGGCDWLHASEAVQREAKKEIVLSALEHLGGLSREALTVRPLLPSPRSMGYRRRAVFHFGGGKLGFFGHHSHAHIAIERCPALTDALAELPRKLSEVLAPLAKDIERVSVVSEGDARAFALHLKKPVRPRHLELCEQALRALRAQGAVLVPPEGSPRTVGEPLLRGIDPLRPEVPRYLRPDVFSQANAEGNVGLVSAAVYELAADDDEVLELYAGSGNFTFAVAGVARSVVAVESAGPAVELALRSAREGGVTNARFVQGDALRVAEGLAAEKKIFPRLLLDPPRTGAPGIGRLARKLGAKRVVYVACDPASLARDAAELKTTGYRPLALQIVDLFPQTRHVEAVMSFDSEGAH
jgi:23S rRNA (uracil1939-C5)-methyltransferase